MLGKVESLLGTIGAALYDVGSNLSGPVYSLPAIYGPMHAAQLAGANDTVIAGMNTILQRQDSATVIFSVSNPFVSSAGAITQDIANILTSMSGFLTNLIDWLYAVTNIDVVTSTFVGAL
jgi:hypothetical protein